MSLYDQAVNPPGSSVSPVLTAEEAQVLMHMRRGHLMSSSDPTDPTRFTSYGQAALVIEALATRLEAAIKASPDHYRLP